MQLGERLLAQRPQRPQQQRPGLIGGERRRTVALAQLVAIRLDDQRHVQVARLRQPEQFLQIQLARRRVEQVGATHHVGHALPGIVQHHGELIGEQAITPSDHEVADFTAQMLTKFALHAIDEVVVQLRHAQADGRVVIGMAGVAAKARIDAGVAFELLA